MYFSRAQSYAERLRLGLAVIHGEAQCSESDMADGRHSPPCVRNTTGHTGLELPCKNTHLFKIFFHGFPCRFMHMTVNAVTIVRVSLFCSEFQFPLVEPHRDCVCTQLL